MKKSAPSECASVEAIKSVSVAWQALAAGTADSFQQKALLDWLINKAAATYDLAYRPGDAGATNFALGRAFVGQQVVRQIKLNINRKED